ncbi:MAG: type II toxin-antitoxin system RelE/ParE family toxin [Pseudomonadota bacterium]
MKLLIARSALNDLQDIQRYYSAQGVPEVGQQLVSALLTKAQRLIDHPDSGRKVPEFDQAQIREIMHPPFRVVYLRDDSAVSVVRVWRSERLLVLPE